MASPTTPLVSDASTISSVAIVGGGLGGLALAHHLVRLYPHIQVTVYERDNGLESRPQGYYIGLNRDGLTSIAPIREIVTALDDMLKVSQNNLRRIAILTGSLRTLLWFGVDANESVLVNRWGLRDCLTSNINIVWQKKFRNYTEFDDHVDIEFDDGTVSRADFMVGADGARSRVRQLRCPDLRNDPLGFSNCGGTIPYSDILHDCPNFAKEVPMTLVRICGKDGHSLLSFTYRGRGESFDSILWSMSWPEVSETEALTRAATSPEELRDVVARQAAKCFESHEIATVLGRTSPEKLIGLNSLRSAQPTKVNPLSTVSRVTLLGDALHPMTTHRGLGANTALVDAARLADALGSKQWNTAVQTYQNEAFERGFSAVAGSLQSTRMIHIRSTIGATMRDCALWCVGCILSTVRFFRG